MRAYRAPVPPLPPYSLPKPLDEIPSLPVEILAVILSLISRTSVSTLALLSHDFLSAAKAWIGPKRLDRVILYCHGTACAYMMSCSGNVMTFCRYLQLEIKTHNIHVSIAILAYKLLPNNSFPTQLCEAQAAISTLLTAGAKPHNITLAGTSAGGNLILQLLGHILHPLPSVSPVPEVCFRGVFLMSPWVSMQEDLSLPQHCLEAKHQYDSVSAQYGRLPCRTLLKDVPLPHICLRTSSMGSPCLRSACS
ncbi:hypothetical protein IW262DRAFT_1281103 [Armillaria fumosa]|nr:hypothetical protein IW262DRAFT_1281103 [Armillaria fumosa]